MIRIFTFLVSFFVFSFAQMSDHFPPLSSRVMDNANLLSLDAKQKLEIMLQNEEQNSSNQIVVATLKTLHGYPIEEFSLALARHWAIGQKDKNNGVLFLIAKEDRKARIEVGYGLEGTLTDKISHEIITYTLIPAFKRGDFDGGVLSSVEQMIKVLKGEKFENLHEEELSAWYMVSPFFIGFLIFLVGSYRDTDSLQSYGFSVIIATFLVVANISEFDSSPIEYISSIISISYVFYLFLRGSSEFDGGSSYSSSSSHNGSSGYSSSYSGGGGSFGGGGASGSW